MGIDEKRLSLKRRNFFGAVNTMKSADSDALSSKQYHKDDLFTEYYQTAHVLRPPYDPGDMKQIYEDSGALQGSVGAYVQNVIGYGHNAIPRIGSEADHVVVDEVPIEKQTIVDLFDTPNGIDSWGSIAEGVYRDELITGNGYLEVIRNMMGKPQLLFHLPSERMRLCPIDKRDIIVDARVRRGGKEISVKVKRRFRRLVMGTPITNDPQMRYELRYFKEYGCPTRMNAITGHYEFERDDTDSTWEEASEVIHFTSTPTTSYGVPRWIGTLLVVLGLRKAEFVNYDLFDSQGIPPLVISVSGGTLTEDALDDLEKFFQNARGTKKFNKVILLDAEASIPDLSGKQTQPKIEFKSLLEFRKDDIMFEKYISSGEKWIRQYGFRLPSLFIGEQDGMNYASARVIREGTEEQVFIPERNRLNAKINRTIVADLGMKDWLFTFKTPVIKTNDELLTMMPHLLSHGAFTTNALIDFVNKTFDLNIKPYSGEDAELWGADVPTPLAFGGLHNFGTTVMQPEVDEGVASNGDEEDESPVPEEKEV